MKGKLYPELRVGMRKVNLIPTVTVENGVEVTRENHPVYVSGTPCMGPVFGGMLMSGKKAADLIVSKLKKQG